MSLGFLMEVNGIQAASLFVISVFFFFFFFLLLFHGFIKKDILEMTGNRMKEGRDDMQQSATSQIRTVVRGTQAVTELRGCHSICI